MNSWPQAHFYVVFSSFCSLARLARQLLSTTYINQTKPNWFWYNEEQIPLKSFRPNCVNVTKCLLDTQTAIKRERNRFKTIMRSQFQ